MNNLNEDTPVIPFPTDPTITCPRCGENKKSDAKWCLSCTDWQERYDEAPIDHEI